jgi:hypothetical protein
LVTFGSPMSDHLIGLELKKRHGLPWMAFFSDPWIDNPFKQFNWVTKKANAQFEKTVMETADRLLFTSNETIDLVLSKYSSEVRRKSRILPHSFEPSEYSQPVLDDSVTIRFLGDLYGPRTPKPLFEALINLHRSDPNIFRGVRFEFVGSMCDLDLEEMGWSQLPEGLVTLVPTVSNRESLQLMSESDALMVIDAPAEQSVFLPSKLIDYLGAAKPILGITPPGTATNLIMRLGGWTANPSDIDEIEETVKALIADLFSRRVAKTVNSPWGEFSVRKRFEAETVGKNFELLVQELAD